MSISSDCSSVCIYEARLDSENTLNLSNKDLESVPIINSSIAVLYLQNNRIKTLPEDFFPSLPNLTYLDLRDNRLTDIPVSIKAHPSLTHLLLQNNCITTLPNELSTVQLKVLQVNGNPLMYPPRQIISSGVAKTLSYLHMRYIDSLQAGDGSENTSHHELRAGSLESMSYNSVIDIDSTKKMVRNDSDEELYSKTKGKCPKLAKSRFKNLPPYYQSAKYLKPLFSDNPHTSEEKIKQNFLKELTMKKRKNFLERSDRIIQERKNLEQLKNWRQKYRCGKGVNQYAGYRLEAKDYPFDTISEYMKFLTREDIEKDLPDKYKKNLIRRTKPTVARKVDNDVHLAMKIKKLFENLESIDSNKSNMTPRTEQKVLLNEIHKISEIKQKLKELSITNMNSITGGP